MLGRDWIEARIPHRGSMCLLDKVIDWSPEGIRCTATSHVLPDNPLRSHGRLGAACGIEYAAQAMAVHGALLAASEGELPQGYLASVRNVALHTDRLDDSFSPLDIEAERISGDMNSIIYSFRVRRDNRILLDGRATVILDAASVRRLET